MSKKDIIIGIILGFLIGLLAIAVFKNLEAEIQERFEGFSVRLIFPLIFVLPLLVVFGLFIADFLSKKIKVIWQLAKFVVVGALNTFVDFGILGFLMWIFDVKKGVLYGFFRLISISCATFNSYFWNKFWTFEKGLRPKGKEFAGFYIITLVGAFINWAVSTSLVNLIGPQFHISATLWAGVVAPFVGVLCGFVWNFLGYKFFIFKK